MRASRRSPPRPGSYHEGSSPPSPVLAAPPARWMPSVTAWWASGDRAPTLIAAATKRRTIARAGSTSAGAPGVGGVAGEHPRAQLREADGAGPRGRGRKAAVDDLRGQVQHLEVRTTDIGGDRADAHPSEGLAQGTLERGEQVD